MYYPFDGGGYGVPRFVAPARVIRMTLVEAVGTIFPQSGVEEWKSGNSAAPAKPRCETGQTHTQGESDHPSRDIVTDPELVGRRHEQERSSEETVAELRRAEN